MPHTDPGGRPADRREIAALVRAFYGQMPFNFFADAGSSAQAVEDNPVRAAYPDLHALLAQGRVARALELGCGAGWLANTLALHYGVEVTAVDFTASALARAREVAALLGITGRTRFLECDLFAFADTARYDLVLSIGVLHHTGDTARGFAQAASFVAPAGHLHLGLYHAPGRRVFLETLRGILAREGEDAAFRLYRSLDRARQGDEALLRSWFRDQVFHPHESQHTLREVAPWLASAGLELTSTSINRFGPVADLESLYALEQTYAERARRALEVEARYFPGFFTVLARRR